MARVVVVKIDSQGRSRGQSELRVNRKDRDIVLLFANHRLRISLSDWQALVREVDEDGQGS